MAIERQINESRDASDPFEQGGRDVAYFNFLDRIILDENDYVKLTVSNQTDATDITAELDSEFVIEAR